MKLTKREIKKYANWINEVHESLYSALYQTEGLLNDPVIRELISNPDNHRELLSKLSEILNEICVYFDDFEASLYDSCLGDFDTLMSNIKGEFE